MVRAWLLIVGCLLTTPVAATPRDDLHSPSQQVRDAAATQLRASFVAPARSRWQPVVAALNPGDSRDTVLHLLAPYDVTMEGRVGGGGSSTETYRLDDSWVLTCSYGRSDELFRTELHEHLRHVWVAPPADFSGVWTTYFVNGRRSQEIHYRNGQHFGTFISFFSNGSKAVVQHNGAEGAEGAQTGYFPSGALSYEGRYSKGKETGTWVWYNEDGSVRSTRENPP
jgi:hypothetical protein